MALANKCYLCMEEDKFVVHDDLEDSFWKLTKGGVFSVQSMHLALQKRPPMLFPCHIVWSSDCVVKDKFFSLGMQPGGKILTLQQLQRSGMALANRCYLCMEDEFSDHLLHFII